MERTTCKKCGEEVSDNFSFCPKCGNPLTGEKPAKKKQDRWTTLLLIALLISVVGYLPIGISKKRKKPLLYVVVDSLKKSGKRKKRKKK